MGAINFIQNLHYSRTIAELAEQLERLDDRQAKDAFVDGGYGKKHINASQSIRMCFTKKITIITDSILLILYVQTKDR
jgi:hypothetical protein